jgi:hypothetical protein
MFAAILLYGVCMTRGPNTIVVADVRTERDTMAAYDAARARAGRTADGQVLLALWCEAHGMPAERLKHLTIAVMKDPSHARARGLMGLVAFRGQWETPDAVSARAQSDTEYAGALARYNSRRSRIGDTANAHWKLALWCEQHGLNPEATAHLARVVALDPSRELAWTRLGYRKQGRRWVTQEQLAAEKAEAAAQRKADRQWRPLLERWRRWIVEPSKEVELIEAISTVSDPRAVPSIWAAFGRGSAAQQRAAVQLLGQIDSPNSTRALALLALDGRTPQVRARAVQTLRLRDPRDLASLLVAMLRDPRSDPDPILFHYQLRPIGWTTADEPGWVMVSGPRYDVAMSYTVPPGLVQMGRSSYAPWAEHADRVMRQVRERQVRDLAALVAQILGESEEYVICVRQHVQQVDLSNARVIQALRAATGQALGDDREAWRKWWGEARGYAYEPPSVRPKQDLTFGEDKPAYYVNVPTTSCFAAGTSVRTLAGPRAIQSIAVGDQVLTQDPHSGALSFRPVTGAAHNKPHKVFTIDFGHESIRATDIHRFWKAGHGWVMTRDLKPGDTVRGLTAVATVKSVEPAGVEPVYNLKVMQAESFFVGDQGLLVHDNSEVYPVGTPFDAVPELNASDSRAEPRVTTSSVSAYRDATGTPTTR